MLLFIMSKSTNSVRVLPHVYLLHKESCIKDKKQRRNAKKTWENQEPRAKRERIGKEKGLIEKKFRTSGRVVMYGTEYVIGRADENARR